MKPLSRRSVTAGLAAAVTAIPALGLPIGVVMAEGEPGGLASLVSRYFAQVDAFNAKSGKTDRESNAIANATYEATMRQMVGMPARTAEDALAAMDWLLKEGADFESEYGDNTSYAQAPFGRVVTSLADAVRGYIVSTDPAQA